MMDLNQNFVSAVASVDRDCNELSAFLSLIEKAISDNFVRGELVLVVRENADEIRKTIRGHFDKNKTSLLVSILTIDATAGQESAMNAGRDLAIGDYVFEFDDVHIDYDEQVIIDAYSKCLEGYDIVTVRNDRKSRLTSRMFYRTYNRMAGGIRSLGPSTFRVLSRRAINRIKSLGTYIPYRKAVYENAGLNNTVITYHSTDTSAATLHSVREARAGLAIDSFIYFTSLMERVSLTVCAIFFLIALAVVIYIVVSIASDEELISGWVSTMGFLSIGFTGLFGLLTIVIKYLSVLVNLVFRHQRYLILDIEKISEA